MTMVDGVSLSANGRQARFDLAGGEAVIAWIETAIGFQHDAHFAGGEMGEDCLACGPDAEWDLAADMAGEAVDDIGSLLSVHADSIETGTGHEEHRVAGLRRETHEDGMAHAAKPGRVGGLGAEGE